jgi:hypothetical protein
MLLFDYEIKDLDGNIISQAQWPQLWHVDKQEIMMGLRDGKIDAPQRKGQFSFPSHMGFGYHGTIKNRYQPAFMVYCYLKISCLRANYKNK